MTEMKPNQYKATLALAVTAVSTEINSFGGSGPIEATAKSHVTSGWDCDEADLWATSLTSVCTPVLSAFDRTLADVQSAHDQEPDEVPETSWKAQAGADGPPHTGRPMPMI